MGGVSSKSPLERRNTVLRRSQRRSIANLKPKIEDVYKNIRKVKETEPGPQYQAVKSDIERLKFELQKRGKDLQPQVIGIHETLVKKLFIAEEMLNVKLEENKSKASAKKDKKDTSKSEEGDVDTVVQEIPEQTTEEEAARLENTESKRHTVELKFVKVVPAQSEEDEQIDVSPDQVQLRTPEDKRKSILRQGGVAVMPGAMMNEITLQSHRISRQYDQPVLPTCPEDTMKSINDTIEQLQEIELEISEFVGVKHGQHYNKIRDELNKHLVNLNMMNPTDEETVEQLKISKNFVGSCLNFLDERAMENVPANKKSVSYDDEVFDHRNENTNNNYKFHNLIKNTPV